MGSRAKTQNIHERKPPVCLSLKGDRNLVIISSKRVACFWRVLRATWKQWLDDLTVRVRKRIRQTRIPQDLLEGNGETFLNESITDNAFAYASVQVMSAAIVSSDGWHTDGWSSLLHAGLTLFGTRTLQVEVAEDSCNEPLELLQRPGSFYVGKLVALNHNVKRTAECHGCFQRQCAYHRVQIAIMARSDVFRAVRARKINSTPGPKELFDLVNTVVASQLAEKPLPMPSLTAILAEAQKCNVPRRG